jgi:hypothetical protein
MRENPILPLDTNPFKRCERVGGYIVDINSLFTEVLGAFEKTGGFLSVEESPGISCVRGQRGNIAQ